jgi:hypothetical protein
MTQRQMRKQIQKIYQTIKGSELREEGNPKQLKEFQSGRNERRAHNFRNARATNLSVKESRRERSRREERIVRKLHTKENEKTSQ